MTTPEQIADGMSEVERAAVLSKGGSHSAVTTKNVEPLWSTITKHSADYFSINLTPLGQQVAAILKEQTYVR